MKSFAAVSVAASLFLSTVSAQYQINPNSVSNSTKDSWCTSQTGTHTASTHSVKPPPNTLPAQCPLICLQTANSATTLANQCDPNLLTYACVCANGLSPNISEYTQTLPFYICQEWGNQCVSNCGQDNQCSSDCRNNHPCGAQSPIRQNTSTLTATMSKTASGSAGSATTTSGQIFTGFAGASSTGGSNAAATSSTHGSGASMRVAALNVGQTFGVLGVVGMLVGGFAVLL